MKTQRVCDLSEIRWLENGRAKAQSQFCQNPTTCSFRHSTLLSSLPQRKGFELAGFGSIKSRERNSSLFFKVLAQCLSKPVSWATCIRIFLKACRNCRFLDLSPKF